MTEVDDALSRAEESRADLEDAGAPWWIIDRLTLADEVRRLRDIEVRVGAEVKRMRLLAFGLGIVDDRESAMRIERTIQAAILRQVIDRMDAGAVDCAAVWWLGDVADAVEEGREW